MRKLIGDTAIVSVVGIVNQSKGIVFIPLIVGAIGLEGYGAFVAILLTVRLVSSFATLELGMGFPRFASGPETASRREAARHFYSVFLPTLALAGLGAGVVWLAAGLLSGWFLEGRYRASLELAALVVVSNGCFAMARNFLRARRQFKLQSALTLAYELLPYLGFVGFAALGRDLASGLSAYVWIDVTLAAVTLVWVARGLPPRLPSPALVRGYLRYTAPLALSYGQGQVLARADLFLVSGMLGLEAAAVYNVVYRVTDLVGFVSIPINVQIVSYLSRTWDGGHQGPSRVLLRKTLLVTLLAATGMLAPIALYIDSLYALFLGEHPPPTPLWPLVLLIGLGMLANIVRRFHYVLIRLHRTTQHELLYQLLGVAINLGLNLLLIPRLGLLGAALATLVSYVAMLPVIGMRYPLGLDGAFFAQLISFGLLAGVMALPRVAVPPVDVPMLVLSGALGASGYLAVVVLFKGRMLRSFLDDLGQWKRLPDTAPISASARS